MEASLNGPLGRTTLGTGTLTIGRSPDNTLVITDLESSAHHAVVAPGYGGNSYQITDLNSTNGTFVNEQRLSPNTPQPLNTGDVIRIGSLRFTYEASSGYAPTVAASSFNSEQTVIDQSQAPQATPYPQIPYTIPTAPPSPPVYQQPGYPQVQPASFNQSSYPPPQPGNFGQPSPPKKKSRAGLWTVLIILLLAIIGGGIGGFVYLQNRSTPEKTLQAFCTALQNGDAQAYYNTLSTPVQEQTDLGKISTFLQLLRLVTGGIINCTYSNVVVNGNNATATLTLTPARGRILSGPVSLVNENGQWKMSSNKSLPTGPA